MIAYYDLEDNIITIFDTYKECAEYFNTKPKIIQCYISRFKHGKVDKKRDFKTRTWGRLYRIEDKC